ncbi:MAG: YesL family protein [Lachnospiraceae bacterium]
MKSIFGLDSPFVLFLNDLTDIVILNVICIICCLPVITIGPSLTALHYVTMRMARDEGGYAVKDFFRAFKQNFVQSTLIWLIFLLISFFFYLDFRIFNSQLVEIPRVLELMIYVLYGFVCLTAMYVFPLISRFSNSVVNSIKNAFLMSIIHIFKTILMMIIYLLPLLLASLHGTLVGVYLLVGIAGPAYINSFFWKGIFKRYEPREEEAGEEIQQNV